MIGFLERILSSNPTKYGAKSSIKSQYTHTVSRFLLCLYMEHSRNEFSLVARNYWPISCLHACFYHVVYLAGFLSDSSASLPQSYSLLRVSISDHTLWSALPSFPALGLPEHSKPFLTLDLCPAILPRILTPSSSPAVFWWLPLKCSFLENLP